MPNELGDRVVSNYSASANKRPGGDCFAIAYERINQASREVCGSSLPSLGTFSAFDRLWGIKIDPKSTWLALPASYRGHGSAGAMVHARRASLVDETAIWSGQLLAGAVVQTWETRADFERVRNGDPAVGIGHSFIFLSYVRTVEAAVTGMKIADQGFLSSAAVPRYRFEFWTGANLAC